MAVSKALMREEAAGPESAALRRLPSLPPSLLLLILTPLSFSLKRREVHFPRLAFGGCTFLPHNLTPAYPPIPPFLPPSPPFSAIPVKTIRGVWRIREYRDKTTGTLCKGRVKMRGRERRGGKKGKEGVRARCFEEGRREGGRGDV